MKKGSIAERYLRTLEGNAVNDRLSPPKLRGKKEPPKANYAKPIPTTTAAPHHRRISGAEPRPPVSLDRERKNLQAYEYLCHIGEAKEWMERVLETKLPPADELPQSLQNGVTLAKIARKFRPDLVPRIFEQRRLQYRHTENIVYFLNFLEAMRIPDLFTFDLIDVYEKRNLPKVIYCIHALSHFLAEERMASAVDNLYGKLEFTDAQLDSVQRGLDAQRGGLPNFRAMNRHFSRQLEPIPPSPNQDISERSVSENETEEYEERDEVTESDWDSLEEPPLARMTTEEKMLIELEEAEPEVIRLQALCRSRFLKNRLSLVLNSSPVKVQAAIRAWLLRRKIPREFSSVIGLQSGIRRLLVKKRLPVSELPKIEYFQAAVRAFIVHRRLNDVRSSRCSSLPFADAVRAYLMRSRMERTRKEVGYHVDGVVALQSGFRGRLLRFKLGCLYDDLDREIIGIISLQARCRGRLAERRISSVVESWNANKDKVILLQAVCRAHSQNKAYRILMADPNPSLRAIKGFLHLINDSDADYQQDIELEELRKTVAQRVQGNEHLEQYIAQLDTKIALLVRNKIDLQPLPKSEPMEQSTKKATGPEKITEFDLKALNRHSRDRLELYQGLFYILQTQPTYVASLLNQTSDHQTSDLVWALYGGAKKRRELYFLLQMLAETTGGGACARIIGKLNARFPATELLSAPIERIRALQSVDLESNPAKLWRQIHGPGNNISAEQAIQDPKVRAQFVKNLQQLREFTSYFIHSLSENADKVAYHIRYLAREAFTRCVSRQSALSVASHIFIDQYIQPALQNADALGLIDAATDGFAAKNLASVGRILSQVASMKSFGDDELYLQPLNEFIRTAAHELAGATLTVTECSSLQDQFEMTNIDDITSMRRPLLTMSTTNIFALHSLIHQHISSIAQPEDAFVIPVLRDLGPLPKNAAEMFDLAKFQEVTLELNPSYGARAHVPMKADSSVLATTKKCLIYVLRVQRGQSLLDVLVSPIEYEHEHAFNFLLQSEEEQAGEIGNLTFRELKLLTLEKVLELESTGFITRNDGYQRLLNSLADDIRHKDQLRQTRAKELSEARATLASLTEKEGYLQSRLNIYNDYIEQAMTTLQTEALHRKKPLLRKLLPNQSDSQRSAKYGSHRCSAEKLADRGILLNLRGYSHRQHKDITFTFTCDEVAKFGVEVAYRGILLPNGSVILTLDTLLSKQYNNNQYIDMFDDAVRFNTNRLLQYIFHKFYGAP